MDNSEYIAGLLSNIVARENLDYESEFGHVVREYSLPLPNGAICKCCICNDDYGTISKEELAKRIHDVWTLSQSIHRRACTAAASSKDIHG